MDIKDSILDCIGNTPLVRLARVGAPRGTEILAKVEGFNPFGSVKERIALEIVEHAERSGRLRPGMVLLESTSGNTGIGLAMVGAARGYRVTVTMPAKASIERRQILRALGAEIVLTPPDGDSDTAWDMAREIARSDPAKYFRVAQYESPHNPGAHYRHTAEEIWRQTSGELDAFVAPLGTTGTVVGTGRRLKELAPSIMVFGAEPDPVHAQVGLRNLDASRIPGIWDPAVVDERIRVHDEEAYRCARDLARKEGILCGISSGSALAAALAVAARGTARRIVVLLPDRGEKYLSTALFRGT